MSVDPHVYGAGGLGQGKRPHGCVLTIFGASGDLTRRKLIPALYNLALERRLPERFAVIGYARSEMTHEVFRSKMREAVSQFSRTGLKDESVWNDFAANLYFIPGSYDESNGYRQLQDFVGGFDRGSRVPPIRVFYLALPPDLYAPVIEQLAAIGLAAKENARDGRTRVVIEKPFGTDLETARELNRRVHEVLDENQVYRIDHYLGKETVQNIMVFRFANAVFEPIWNRRYVDHVQITAAESVGVENRGGYYEDAGVVRDMFQNHLLQLFCLTAMEPPVAFSADAVREEKGKLLRSVRPIFVDDVARIAVRLRSGKRMAKRVSEIAIQFKRPPLLLFRSCAVDDVNPNVLVVRIQPDEGISLTFEVKPPGPDICVSPLSLDFNYEEGFGSAPPEAYETLLEDCIEGDSTLFTRHDWVESAWSLMDPIIQAWRRTAPKDFPNYEAGSWGPKEADEFMQRDGRRWRRP